MKGKQLPILLRLLARHRGAPHDGHRHNNLPSSWCPLFLFFYGDPIFHMKYFFPLGWGAAGSFATGGDSTSKVTSKQPRDSEALGWRVLFRREVNIKSEAGKGSVDFATVWRVRVNSDPNPNPTSIFEAIQYCSVCRVSFNLEGTPPLGFFQARTPPPAGFLFPVQPPNKSLL